MTPEERKGLKKDYIFVSLRIELVSPNPENMLAHYIRVTFRTLWKSKAQSAISIAGLSVGLACFSICFYVVRAMATADTSYPDSDRMFTVKQDDRLSDIPLIGKFMQDAYPEVEDYLSVRSYYSCLFAAGEEDGREADSCRPENYLHGGRSD